MDVLSTTGILQSGVGASLTSLPLSGLRPRPRMTQQHSRAHRVANDTTTPTSGEFLLAA